jgi:hypothetical protein
MPGLFVPCYNLYIVRHKPAPAPVIKLTLFVGQIGLVIDRL